MNQKRIQLKRLSSQVPDQKTQQFITEFTKGILKTGDELFNSDITPELKAKLTKGEEVELCYIQFGQVFYAKVRNLAQARGFFLRLATFILVALYQIRDVELRKMIIDETFDVAFSSGMEMVTIEPSAPSNVTPKLAAEIVMFDQSTIPNS